MGAMLEDVISERVNSLLQGKSKIKFLEAGCGSASHFSFAPVLESVGIDISQEQLGRNTVVQEKILGDIQTYPLPKEEFDVVVCWNVLEHLSRPRDALLNLFKAVKPGGLVILGFPNLFSFKGLITKLTPLWFHRLCYRFMKYKSLPFPTYLRLGITPNKVTRLAEDNDLSTVFFKLVEGGFTKRVRNRFWLINALFFTLNSAVLIASLGKLRSLYLDYCALVLKKRLISPEKTLEI